MVYNEAMNSRGQPRRFQTGQELEETMMSYVKWCEENNHMPNVAGFCVHADITYDTFYQQKGYYPESYVKINMLLETAVINSNKNSDSFRAFYMKNKFGYTDKVEQSIVTPEPLKIQNIQKLSNEDLLLLKQITSKLESDE